MNQSQTVKQTQTEKEQENTRVTKLQEAFKSLFNTYSEWEVRYLLDEETRWDFKNLANSNMDTRELIKNIAEKTKNSKKETDNAIVWMNDCLSEEKIKKLYNITRNEEAGLREFMIMHSRPFSTATPPTDKILRYYDLEANDIGKSIMDLIRFRRVSETIDGSEVYRWAMTVRDPYPDPNNDRKEIRYLGKEGKRLLEDITSENQYLSETESISLNTAFERIEKKNSSGNYKNYKNGQEEIANVYRYLESLIEYYRAKGKNKDYQEQFRLIEELQSEILKLDTDHLFSFASTSFKDADETNNKRKALEDNLAKMANEYDNKTSKIKNNSIFITEDITNIFEDLLSTIALKLDKEDIKITYQNFKKDLIMYQKNIAVVNNVLKSQYSSKYHTTDGHKDNDHNYKVDMQYEQVKWKDNEFMNMIDLINWRNDNDNIKKIEANGAQRLQGLWNSHVDKVTENNNSASEICEKIKKRKDPEALDYWKVNEKCQKKNVKLYLSKLFEFRKLKNLSLKSLKEHCKKVDAAVESCDELMDRLVGSQDNEDSKIVEDAWNESTEKLRNSKRPEFSNVQMDLRKNEYHKYLWKIATAKANGTKSVQKRDYKEVKIDGKVQTPVQKSKAEPRAKQNEDAKPVTSAAPPSIKWDATMILAFLIVVFIAN